MLKSLYNTNGMIFNLCMESIPIETYEPCQIREEAAINRESLCGILSVERLNNQPFFRYIKDVIIWGTQLFIESLDH